MRKLASIQRVAEIRPIEGADAIEPEIKFEEPDRWKYEKVIPIQFSILHRWTDKDKGLYYES